jgi:hypothetical protein
MTRFELATLTLAMCTEPSRKSITPGQRLCGVPNCPPGPPESAENVDRSTIILWAPARRMAIRTCAALTVIAQFAMAESWRIGVDPNERTPLVTTGAFAMVRNPIFTAMLVTASDADDPQRCERHRARRVDRRVGSPSEARRGAITSSSPTAPTTDAPNVWVNSPPTIGRLS